MKKSFIFFASLAAVLTFACTPAEVPEPVEIIVDPDNSGISEDPAKPDTQETIEYREVTLSAQSDDLPTKSSRDANGKFYWSAGDQISVFRGSYSWKMTSTNTEPVAHAQFVGEAPVPALDNLDSKYYAIYPYSEDNGFDGTYLTATVPTSQVAAAGTFADGQFISIGCSDNLSMTFYHLCGGIKFSLSHTGITSVTLRGNNDEIIAGKVLIALDSDGHPQVNSITEGSKVITLTCPGGFQTGVDYFFVTLPVEFTYGFTVDFGNGHSRTILNSMTVNRAKFQRSQNAIDYIYDETCDIENAGVRSYLDNVDYSNDTDYTISYVANYKPSGSDSPLPVTLSWEGGTADQILISTAPSFDGATVVSGTTSPVSVYNLIPGVKYYYKVLRNNSVLKTACVTPVGPIRMIYVPSVHIYYDNNHRSDINRNARDLGGWATDGGHIAYGKIYRGARLNDMQDNSSAKNIILNTLGVDVDLDLRGAPEGNQGGSGQYNPWLSSDDVVYCNIKPWNYFYDSVSYRTDPPSNKMGVSADLYQLSIRYIINWLKDGKVIYFHCHGGSDRTGTLAFLIEALLGVSESDLSKDYELTYFSGSLRRRNGNADRNASDGGWFFSPMVRYLRTFAPNSTIKEQVKAWAKTRHSNDVDPLTDAEIEQLRSLLIATD